MHSVARENVKRMISASKQLPTLTFILRGLSTNRVFYQIIYIII